MKLKHTKTKSKYGLWLMGQFEKLGLDWLSFAHNLNLTERTFRRHINGETALTWEMIVKACTLLSKTTGHHPIIHILDCVTMMATSPDELDEGCLDQWYKDYRTREEG